MSCHEQSNLYKAFLRYVFSNIQTEWQPTSRSHGSSIESMDCNFKYCMHSFPELPEPLCLTMITENSQNGAVEELIVVWCPVSNLCCYWISHSWNWFIYFRKQTSLRWETECERDICDGPCLLLQVEKEERHRHESVPSYLPSQQHATPLLHITSPAQLGSR